MSECGETRVGVPAAEIGNGVFFFFFKCLIIYLDPRTKEKYKRNKMGNKPINP